MMEDRYSRQIGIVGGEGQIKLSKSTVLIIGAGGLGNIAAKYLASAGVGCILISDYDVIEKSNLNRQILFNNKSIGKNKAMNLVKTLIKINPEVFYLPCPYKVNEKNFKPLVNAFKPNVILDCVDNYETSFIINFVARLYDTPVAYGKTDGMSGTFCFIDSIDKYRLFFPSRRGKTIIEQKSRGILGPVGGIIGSYQAMETIKYIVGKKTYNKVLFYDGMRNYTKEAEIKMEVGNESHDS